MAGWNDHTGLQFMAMSLRLSSMRARTMTGRRKPIGGASTAAEGSARARTKDEVDGVGDEARKRGIGVRREKEGRPEAVEERRRSEAPLDEADGGGGVGRVRKKGTRNSLSNAAAPSSLLPTSP